jgi:DNA-binding beta-propeller fold protein YncE
MSGRRLAAVWILLALGTVVPAHAEGPPPLRLTRKIELPGVQGRIDHMSVDAEGRRLFVAALVNGTIEVVDLEAGKRAQTIHRLAEPQGVLFVKDQNRLVVANRQDGSVRIYDGTSLELRETAPLGADADNVRLDPATGRVWVGHGDGALTAIDASGAKLATVSLGAHPESFQLERNGPRIFVNLPDARKIGVVDRRQPSVIASWTTGNATQNFPMALDEAHKRLFVVCRTPARLLVLDSDSGKIVATLPTVGDCDDVFYDQGAQRLYVSGGEGAIVVYRQLDPDRYEEAARLATVKGARTSLFSADLRRLFLAVRQEGATPAAVWVYEAVK